MYKILLVEDEENIREGLTQFFDWEEANSVLVSVAINGNNGIEKIHTMKPDIVITDVRMPYMNGLEMIEEASKFHTFKSIIISGYNDFEYARSALRLGVNEYILKPIDFDELRDAVLRIQSKQNKTEYIEQKKSQPFIDYIKDHIGERVYVTDLSDHFDLSGTTINEIIKDELNTTANDLINTIKIDYAISLLKLNKYKMYEITDMTGFSNYKYFNHVFKKYKGVSPSKYLEK